MRSLLEFMQPLQVQLQKTHLPSSTIELVNLFLLKLLVKSYELKITDGAITVLTLTRLKIHKEKLHDHMTQLIGKLFHVFRKYNTFIVTREFLSTEATRLNSL